MIDPAASPGPRLKAPPGAVDTNIHILDQRYPLAPTALAQPPDAGVAEYREVMRRLGLTRTVVVQPTAYGTDNRCTLDAVAAFGLDTARAVGVVDASISPDEMARMTAAGMRGARFHLLGGAAVPIEQFDAIAAKAHEAGWHVQFQCDGRRLPYYAAQIRAWPCTVVIDHVGKYLEPVAVDDPAFRCLLDLVETGRVYVKLSAPYETSKLGAPLYGDVGALAKALVRAAPERMVWATNWPHLALTDKPDDAGLLDLLLDWAGDEATRRRILVDNPTALYGF
ncbi:amidohydrolase [Bosea caraganae]|uniref:Amidohydrolase n=1 Tax=Bosea caraganae TaxID=2763117 RepID=A0A370L6Y3_9HYPH|nr:amidohydrolase family protein [Bosea caraganae]RDJ25496.1 amidohydrolase [Bosea caraganae]RDJ25717.1 amidohydrolase [Bosea caraganae]